MPGKTFFSLILSLSSRCKKDPWNIYCMIPRVRRTGETKMLEARAVITFGEQTGDKERGGRDLWLLLKPEVLI